jgi:hypothetical protein
MAPQAPSTDIGMELEYEKGEAMDVSLSSSGSIFAVSVGFADLAYSVPLKKKDNFTISIYFEPPRVTACTLAADGPPRFRSWIFLLGNRWFHTRSRQRRTQLLFELGNYTSVLVHW